MQSKIIAGVLTTGLMLGGYATAHAAVVTVVAASGRVTVSERGVVVKAMPGASLTLPVQISTGADGSLDVQQAGSTFHVGSDATVAIPDSGAAPGTVDRILQQAGQVLYNIKLRNGRPFAVETPYLVSVVKGTLFSIAIENRAATVALLEGSLDVSAPGVSDHILLKPNQAIRHAEGETHLTVNGLEPRAATAVGVSNRAESTWQSVDEAQGRQIDRVTTDLASVTAVVAGQRAQSAARATPAGPGVGTPPPPGASGTPNPSGGASSGTSTGGASDGSGSGTSSQPPSNPDPTGTGTSGSGGGGTGASTGTSGSGSGTGTGSGAGGGTGTGTTGTGTGTGAGTTGTGTGCNGKSNGTGNGNCYGHGKQKGK